MIKIVKQVFDPWQFLQQFQENSEVLHSNYGATSIFIGTMRDFNAGDTVKGMTLEYYPGMTEHQLQQIIEQAKNQWQILDALVVHRVGFIVPDESIVLVAVWSAHRADAFDSCRFIMEALKSKAPFWKKEVLDSGMERWVSNCLQ